MYNKLRILKKYCNEHGMKVNNTKTKFFVINGESGDSESFYVNGMIVEHCHSYMYLWSPFTCDGSVSAAVRWRAKKKLCHVLKFISFLKKKQRYSFYSKETGVWRSSSFNFSVRLWVMGWCRHVYKHTYILLLFSRTLLSIC